MSNNGRGRFGKFGGQYVPETLMPALAELEAAYDEHQSGIRRFNDEFQDAACKICGTPDAAVFCETADRIVRRRENLSKARRFGAHGRAQDQ